MPGIMELLLDGTDKTSRTVAAPPVVRRSMPGSGRGVWGAITGMMVNGTESRRVVGQNAAVGLLPAETERNNGNEEEEKLPTLGQAIGTALKAKALTLPIRDGKGAADIGQEVAYKTLARLQRLTPGGEDVKLVVPTFGNIKRVIDWWEKQYAEVLPPNFRMMSEVEKAKTIAALAQEQWEEIVQGGKEWRGPITEHEKDLARDLVVKWRSGEDDGSLWEVLAGQVLLRCQDRADVDIKARMARMFRDILNKQGELRGKSSGGVFMTDWLTAKLMLEKKDADLLQFQTWEVTPDGIVIENPKRSRGEMETIYFLDLIFPQERPSVVRGSVRLNVDAPDWASVIGSIGGGLFKGELRPLTNIGGLVRFDSLNEVDYALQKPDMGTLAVRQPKDVTRELGRMRKLSMGVEDTLGKILKVLQEPEVEVGAPLRPRVVWDELRTQKDAFLRRQLETLAQAWGTVTREKKEREARGEDARRQKEILYDIDRQARVAYDQWKRLRRPELAG